MGKNRHAFTDSNGNLVYYSNKEGKIAGKSGGKILKEIAKTLRNKKRLKVEKNDAMG
tara:strand:+ start:393 stop:563 length:171 start_codon:yes stop_codon:yes gene_type:complete